MGAPKGHKPYAGCETGGRPRKYNKDNIEKFADEFLIWLKDPNNIWYQDFCLDRDIDPDFMAEWAEENEKFNGVYKLAKHKQKSKLINGGLHNKLNTNIIKLVMANVHGWSDKQETKVAGIDPNNPSQYWVPEASGKSKELVNDTTSQSIT